MQSKESIKTAQPEIEIHIHDVLSFLSCRRAWDFGSPARQNLTIIQPNKNLFLGTGIHYALQQYYNPSTFNAGILIDPVEPFEEWFSQEKKRILTENEPTAELEEMLNEQHDLGVGMLRHYALWAPNHDDFTVVGTELAFKVPLMKSPDGIPVYYVGRIDKILQDSHGRLWAAEFKTWAQIDLDRLKLEMQPTAYLWALRKQYDVKVEGMLYTILRKKVPRKPAPLISGGFSKAKNIDTTYEVYLATLQEANEDPKAYQEVLDTLKEKGNTFFVREAVYRTEGEITSFESTLRNILRDMLSEDLSVYPAPEPLKCRSCQFKPACLALAEGRDVNFILQTLFRKRTMDDFTPLEDALSEVIIF